MQTVSQFLWHTTPLFHLPHLLSTGAIYSATEIAARGLPVRPRPSAIARKRKLGLANYVHLSPRSRTPLLHDKQIKGYPHVLLAFRRGETLALPGVALLKYNTKRWAHRDDFVPITGAEAMATIWAEHGAGKYPSLEVLLPASLPVSLVADIHVASDTEAELLRSVAAALSLPATAILVSPERFPVPSAASDLTAVRTYFGQCESVGRVLPPPALPFD